MSFYALFSFALVVVSLLLAVYVTWQILRRNQLVKELLGLEEGQETTASAREADLQGRKDL
jgi:hypothetical protein